MRESGYVRVDGKSSEMFMVERGVRHLTIFVPVGDGSTIGGFRFGVIYQ